MRVAGIALLLVLAAGCGGGARHPAVSRDGKAVLRDAYDGRLDRSWSCGSLRAAVRRLPSSTPTYATLPAQVTAAAGRACDTALAHVAVGAPAREVRSALGRPDRSPRCLLYRWPPAPGSAVDGARICFASGRVSSLQRAVHG